MYKERIRKMEEIKRKYSHSTTTRIPSCYITNKTDVKMNIFMLIGVAVFFCFVFFGFAKTFTAKCIIVSVFSLFTIILLINLIKNIKEYKFVSQYEKDVADSFLVSTGIGKNGEVEYFVEYKVKSEICDEI
jgi:hypothetical protein